MGVIPSRTPEDHPGAPLSEKEEKRKIKKRLPVNDIYCGSQKECVYERRIPVFTNRTKKIATFCPLDLGLNLRPSTRHLRGYSKRCFFTVREKEKEDNPGKKNSKPNCSTATIACFRLPAKRRNLSAASLPGEACRVTGR